MQLDQRCAEHVGTLDDANSSFVCQLQIVVELCCKILFAEKGMVDRREGYPRTARIRLAEQKRRLLSRFISGQEMRPELAMQGAGEFQGVHALHPLLHPEGKGSDPRQEVRSSVYLGRCPPPLRGPRQKYPGPNERRLVRRSGRSQALAMQA